ncbi:ankyrin repeat-containing domain protein [Mycena vulgaris]|nr:ankyrin repeat-containing domain protein [Mycena vulgaris]
MAEALGIVTSSIQLLDMAMKVFEYVKDFHNAPEEQHKLLAEMNILKPMLVELQSRVRANPSSSTLQQMKEPLNRFKTTMGHFTRKLEAADPGGWSKLSRRITWSLWSKKEAKENLDEFERMKSSLTIWLNMDSWDMGRQQKKDHDDQQKQLGLILSEAESEKQRAEATKRAEINGWITPLNFVQRQNDLQKWKSGSGKILWCRGMSGAGKTVLVSMDVDHLRSGVQDNKTCVACIYLNHKETSTHTTPNLLASLWKQLVVGKPIPPEATQLYENHHKRSTKPSLDEILQILRSAIAEYPKIYLIVDALDEYPELQRNILLEYLSTMIGPTVNLMLTSRPQIALHPFFPKLDILEIRAAADDICLYIDMHVLKSPRLSKHVRTRPELHGEIRSKTLTNVEGMFLLANIESLTTKNTVKAVREALQRLPQDLNHTYDEAMERINHQSTDDRQLALLVLTWVANAVRPLSVADLREALAVEPGTTTLDVDNLLDVDILLSVCTGLITVEEIKSAVRLIHYSTQDYFDHIRHLLTEEPVQINDRFDALCVASYYDHLAMVQLLVQYGANMEHDTQGQLAEALQAAAESEATYYGTALHAASTNGHELVVRFLIQEGFDVNSWVKYHGTTLQATAIEGNSESMLQLLAERYAAALQRGSRCGDALTVRLLIKMGADVNTIGGFYGTALQTAAAWGHTPVASVLIELGADVNVQAGRYGMALHAAIQPTLMSRNPGRFEGRTEPLVRLLVENGADVNAQRGGYGTVVQAASIHGCDAGIQHLRELMPSKGLDYGTVLQTASQEGDEAMVQLLINVGADPVVRLLIEMGANVNMRGGHLETILLRGLDRGDESGARQILGELASIDTAAQGEFMGIPLQAASVAGHESVARLLIEKAADVNAFRGSQGTALQAASLHGYESVAQLLIANGADVNAVGGFFGTALQAASRQGH